MRTVLSRRDLLHLGMAAPAVLARARAQAQDLEPTTSRVHPGKDGRLN